MVEKIQELEGISRSLLLRCSLRDYFDVVHHFSGLAGTSWQYQGCASFWRRYVLLRVVFTEIVQVICAHYKLFGRLEYHEMLQHLLHSQYLHHKLFCSVSGS